MLSVLIPVLTLLSVLMLVLFFFCFYADAHVVINVGVIDARVNVVSGIVVRVFVGNVGVTVDVVFIDVVLIFIENDIHQRRQT